jgi:hypothetical protein
MARVIARHQRATRRHANRTAGITLGEARALFRQFINVRRLDELLSAATDIGIAQIVGHNKNNVRFFSSQNGICTKDYDEKLQESGVAHFVDYAVSKPGPQLSNESNP